MKLHQTASGPNTGKWVQCSAKKCRNGGSHVSTENLRAARDRYQEETGITKVRMSDVPAAAVNNYLAEIPTKEPQVLSAQEAAIRRNLLGENDDDGGLDKTYIGKNVILTTTYRGQITADSVMSNRYQLHLQSGKTIPLDATTIDDITIIPTGDENLDHYYKTSDASRPKDKLRKNLLGMNVEVKATYHGMVLSEGIRGGYAIALPNNRTVAISNKDVDDVGLTNADDNVIAYAQKKYDKNPQPCSCGRPGPVRVGFNPFSYEVYETKNIMVACDECFQDSAYDV